MPIIIAVEPGPAGSSWLQLATGVAVPADGHSCGYSKCMVYACTSRSASAGKFLWSVINAWHIEFVLVLHAAYVLPLDAMDAPRHLLSLLMTDDIGQPTEPHVQLLCTVVSC